MVATKTKEDINKKTGQIACASAAATVKIMTLHSLHNQLLIQTVLSTNFCMPCVAGVPRRSRHAAASRSARLPTEAVSKSKGRT